jgi:hypothetical protein
MVEVESDAVRRGDHAGALWILFFSVPSVNNLSPLTKRARDFICIVPCAASG